MIIVEVAVTVPVYVHTAVVDEHMAATQLCMELTFKSEVTL